MISKKLKEDLQSINEIALEISQTPKDKETFEQRETPQKNNNNNKKADPHIKIHRKRETKRNPTYNSQIERACKI